MTHLVRTALIVGFAACNTLKLAYSSGAPNFVEAAAVNRDASISQQTSGEGGSTGSPVSKSSSQAGRTADVQISNAIGAVGYRGGLISADYVTDQTWAACPAWGTRNITLVLYPVTYTIATNCIIPANVTLQFSHGSCLAPGDGTSTTIKGYFTAPMSKIFCNAVSGKGAVRLASVDSSDEGGQALVDVYPEWWGATAGDATGATNTPAIQAAIIGAYGNNRTNATPYPKYNRVLHFSALYNINAELHVYHMIGFRWEGENQFGSGLRQRTCGLRIIDGQSIAYGRFENLRFENGCGERSGAALVDIDYSRAKGVDLSPQNITFYDNFFAGNGLTDVGVLIAKSGGGSQGDNIRCYNCYFNGFTGAGWQIGGNNTGRNAGRYYAQNAIKEQIIGGDIQGCPLYGVAAYGGSYEVYGTTFEDNVGGNVSQNLASGGSDLYCEAPQGAPCRAQNIRSESLALAKGGPWSITDSGLNTNWATTFDNVAGNREPLNQLITGTWVGGDGKYYQVTTAGTFGGLPLTTATSGSFTSLVVSGARYTANAFIGYKASIMKGTDLGCYGLVTSNNATTITFSGGLVTDYGPNISSSAVSCAATPDATSKFVLEPNWGTQTTSGTATFALFDFNAIDGPFNNGTPGSLFELHNITILNGGRINAAGTFEDISVTRTDWMPTGNQVLEGGIGYSFKNILVQRNGRPCSSCDVPWNFVRNGITGYKDYSQFQIGGLPVCWALGAAGGASVDACINPDNSLGAKLGRLQIVNGSGGIAQTTNFNADGSTQFPSVTFATLPSSPNGSVIFCSDCNSTCTAGSSTGRTCFRENGAWTH